MSGHQTGSQFTFQVDVTVHHDPNDPNATWMVMIQAGRCSQIRRTGQTRAQALADAYRALACAVEAAEVEARTPTQHPDLPEF